LFVQFWWLCQSLLVNSTPQFMYGWRRVVLRAFGAKVGSGVLIRPSVTVTYPWKVEIGDNAWIGDDVELYSLGQIRIGRDAVVSQGTYVCAGTHDHRDPTFPIEARPITIDDEAWVAAQSFLCPGVTIGFGAVVAARSVVTRDVAPLEVVAGNPARAISARLE
jgi:putative colanic acid biosynthesis acetyltransferase WcaF